MTSPLSFLRESINAVPAVKYALGIGGIVATIAIIYSLPLDPRVAAIGTLVMLVLMFVLVIFARMTLVSGSRMLLPALVLTWFSILLFMTVSGTLFACVFFGQPRDLSAWLIGKSEARPAATVRTPYVSEFVATLPMNTAFDAVRMFYETELLRTRETGPAEQTAADVAKLLDHYVAERTRYYADFRDHQSHSALVTSDGQRKPLVVNCPNNMIIEDHTAAVIAEEGTCHGPDVLPNKAGASGMVSQAGAGRSACKLVATCRYTPRYVQAAVMRERAVLSNMAR